jgi:hypothetical protein
MENQPHEILNLENTSSLEATTKGDERLVTILFKKIEELEQNVHTLQTKQIIDELQLPTEVLANSGLLPSKPKKLKRGLGYRPLLQSEIEEAKTKSPFAAQQARWLGVSAQTYKKYAKLYGIYSPSPHSKGKRNLFDPQRGRFPLNKILEGQFRDNPSVCDWMVKDKLIRSGTFPPKCNICGYDKRRITDDKIALLLDHKDGDRRNYLIDNLQLLCLNCTFECGRGYIRRGKHTFDVDWMQGARTDDVDLKSRW